MPKTRSKKATVFFIGYIYFLSGKPLIAIITSTSQSTVNVFDKFLGKSRINPSPALPKGERLWLFKSFVLFVSFVVNVSPNPPSASSTNSSGNQDQTRATRSCDTKATATAAPPAKPLICGSDLGSTIRSSPLARRRASSSAMAIVRAPRTFTSLIPLMMSGFALPSDTKIMGKPLLTAESGPCLNSVESMPSQWAYVISFNFNAPSKAIG